MSDVKHTPEPWVLWKYPNQWTFTPFRIDHGELNDADPVAAVFGRPEAGANAKRIVACVNALAGKPYPEFWVKEAEEILNKIYSFEHPEMKLGESKVDALLKIAAERDKAIDNVLMDVRIFVARLSTGHSTTDALKMIDEFIYKKQQP